MIDDSWLLVYLLPNVKKLDTLPNLNKEDYRQQFNLRNETLLNQQLGKY